MNKNHSKKQQNTSYELLNARVVIILKADNKV